MVSGVAPETRRLGEQLFCGAPDRFSLPTVRNPAGRQIEPARRGCYPISRRFEPVKAAAAGWRQNHFILQVGKIQRGRVCHVRPVRGGQIQILLQDEIRRRNNTNFGLRLHYSKNAGKSGAPSPFICWLPFSRNVCIWIPVSTRFYRF